MTFGDCLEVFKTRMANNPAAKPNTKEYYRYLILALEILAGTRRVKREPHHPRTMFVTPKCNRDNQISYHHR